MKKLGVFSIFIAFAIGLVLFYNAKNVIRSKDISSKVNELFLSYISKGENASGVIKNKKIDVIYSLNISLQDYIRKLLQRYKTPYAAIAVIENRTGRVLALVGRDHSGKRNYDEITISSTNPAASMFKIVTAASLFELGKIKPTSKVLFNGKGTTLYKSQLKNKKTRWTRKITFGHAFAFSNNVVFGRLAQKYLSGDYLEVMARKFGFNEKITHIVEPSLSKFYLPQSNYQLAEFGSGFNKYTTISPLHAAYMSYIISNGGIRKKIRVVDGVQLDNKFIDLEDKKLVKRDDFRVLSKDTISKLKEIMKDTVKKGTARGITSLMRGKLRKELLIGAKTGSITGGFPDGKREWVTAFAVPKNDQSGGISIAVLNILHDRWYIRSSYLAKKVIEYYYTKIEKI